MNLRACDPRASESLMTPPIARCQGSVPCHTSGIRGSINPCFGLINVARAALRGVVWRT